MSDERGWPGTGTAEVWQRLRRPFDPIFAVDALLGLSPASSRQLVGVVLATSQEAEQLLDRMPHTIRSLAVSTTMRPTRCIGEVRGPVMWSETLAARGASPGAADVFICSSAVRAFDTEENRVLAAALAAVRDAGDNVDSVGSDSYDDERLRRARFNGARALRYLEHRTLLEVSRGRPNGRALRRARAGSRRHDYHDAVAMLARAEEPLTLDHVMRFCDQRTRAQHDLLAALIQGLEARDIPVPVLFAGEGDIYGGPVRYSHPRKRGGTNRVSGILVGQLLVDVPDRLNDHNPYRAQADLEARADGRRHYLVQTAADIPRAVELAVRAIRGFS
jgi:hypothetical protein